MKTREDVIGMMYADLESVSGAPTDQELLAQIREANRPLEVVTEITPLVRQGFLEGHRIRSVIDEIRHLPKGNLDVLVEETACSLDPDVEVTPRIADLRFIYQAARQAQAFIENTTYLTAKEGEI